MSTNMNETNYDTFYLVDLDRTLLDTATAADVMIDLIHDHSPEMATYIHDKLNELLGFGVSYSIRDAIAEKGGEEMARAIDEAFIEYGRIHNLKYEGADALLEFAAQSDKSGVGILTYGSPVGQQVKLRAAGFESIPTLVTDQKYKGKLLSEWQSNGLYKLPEEYGSVAVKEIVFVDDKVLSFDGVPEAVVGYWLTQEVSLLDAVEYPENVTPVSTLTAIIEAEQERRGL